jgi:hypothetical protein
LDDCKKKKEFLIYNIMLAASCKELVKMAIENGLLLLHVYVQCVNIYLLLLFILQLLEIYKLLGLKILIPRSILSILLHLKRSRQMIN